MNPRIQELAYEAEDYADSIVDQGGEFHPAYTKKFAELLVRECAGACLHDDWEDPRWGRFYSNKIKEHFGVK